MAAAAPVEVRGLEKRYDEVVAVDKIDLTVEPGDVYGFLGPNGVFLKASSAESPL